MRRSLGPLLCELHAHTRWSDGELTVAELVDLYGRSGFDVLCVTDHVVRADDPWREEEGARFSSIEAGASRSTSPRSSARRRERRGRTGCS